MNDAGIVTARSVGSRSPGRADDSSRSAQFGKYTRRFFGEPLETGIMWIVRGVSERLLIDRALPIKPIATFLD